MAATVLSICQRALLAAGAREEISSINEDSTAANSCALLFEPTFQQLARTAHWNCLAKQAPLSLIKAAIGTPENQNGTLPVPPPPWLYAYAYPADSLQERWIVPSLTPTQTTGVNPIPISPNLPYCGAVVSGNGRIPYQVRYDDANPTGSPLKMIVCNQSGAQAVYTVDQPNPAIWDSLFQQGMVATLAVFLIANLNMNIQLMQMNMGMAKDIIAQARASDGNEGTTSVNRNASWMTARMRGGPACGGYGGYYNNFLGNSSYCDINWPNFG